MGFEQITLHLIANQKIQIPICRIDYLSEAKAASAADRSLGGRERRVSTRPLKQKREATFVVSLFCSPNVRNIEPLGGVQGSCQIH